MSDIGSHQRGLGLKNNLGGSTNVGRGAQVDFSVSKLTGQFRIGKSGVTQVASQTGKIISENTEFAQLVKKAKELVMVT